MTRKQRRASFIAFIFMLIAFGVGLILMGLKDSLVFFYSPSEVAEKQIPVQKAFRLGGLVEGGSVQRMGVQTQFRVSDGNKNLVVHYSGILPDLFREGQGVVCEGQLISATVFLATSVLAKHDENYMPKEVVEALKKQGQWQGQGQTQGTKQDRAPPVSKEPKSKDLGQ